MEDHGRGMVVVVACRITVSAPVPVSFLSTLDLDLGLTIKLRFLPKICLADDIQVYKVSRIKFY